MMTRRPFTDRLVTGVVLVLVVGWSLVYAVVGPLLLRPVSTCAGPSSRCTAAVDAGVGLASWGPLLVAAATLAVLGRQRRSGGRTWPVAVGGLVLVLALQLLGQAMIPLGVVPR